MTDEIPYFGAMIGFLVITAFVYVVLGWLKVTGGELEDIKWRWPARANTNLTEAGIFQ